MQGPVICCYHEISYDDHVICCDYVMYYLVPDTWYQVLE